MREVVDVSDPADRLGALLRRYKRQSDPGERVETLAELQRATGPALRDAVETWREETGAEWSTMAARLGMARPTLYRQYGQGSITAGPAPDREERRSA